MLLRPFVRSGRPGLIGTMARTTIVVGTGKAVAGWRVAPSAGQGAAGRSRTEEEFAAQKARILEA